VVCGSGLSGRRRNDGALNLDVVELLGIAVGTLIVKTWTCLDLLGCNVARSSEFRATRGLLDSRSPGEVRRFEVGVRAVGSAGRATSGWRGPLRDFGSYVVDQALHLFPPVQRLYAQRHEVGPESEDDLLVLLQPTSGMRSQIYGGWRQNARELASG